jgi:hypothetical protein
LTFTRRTRTSPSNANYLEFWYAPASSALTSESITVHTNSSGFLTVCAFAVSGYSMTDVFDPNGALPNVSGTGSGSGSANPTFTTTNPDNFLIACYRQNVSSSTTAGTGWTLITGSNFLVVEYKVVSTTQSGLVASISANNENGIIGDAITGDLILLSHKC